MENFREILLKVYSQTNNFGNENGMILEKFEEDGIVYRMKIRPDHLATPTTAHGGVIAALMDGVIGVAALYFSAADGNLVSTVEFKINYLTPARLGDVLIGKGWVISKGKRIIVAQGEIFNETTGENVAVASGTFNAYPYQKSGMDFENFDL